MTWILKEIQEFFSADGSVDWWNLVFEVPLEFAPDGVYSVSFPKNIMCNMAATFGFDLDDEDDIDELFDYIIHMSYMNEVARRSGTTSQVSFSPYEVDQATSRRLIRENLSQFKDAHSISVGSNVMLSNNFTSSKSITPDPLFFVKSELSADSDRDLFRKIAEESSYNRSLAIDAMVSSAFELNEKISRRQVEFEQQDS